MNDGHLDPQLDENRVSMTDVKNTWRCNGSMKCQISAAIDRYENNSAQ